MRPAAVILSLLVALTALGQVSPADDFLNRGTTAYRQGDFASAAIDLQAATIEFLSAETMRAYVNGGKLANIDKLEKALLYLALSQSRLGRESEAREAILRLMAAERIEPTYSRLQIAEAAEFETLVASLVPGAGLPPNTQVVPAAPDSATTTIEDETAPLPQVTAAAQPAAPLPAVTPVQTDAEERVERERIVAELIAGERAAAAPIQEATTDAQRAFVTSLRQAGDMMNRGDLEGANAIYARVAANENAPREVLAEAAVGLYRTGSFRNAAAAFRRLGRFAKGEEDLRYYNAVALYEIGDYQEAMKELACALPYIEVTEDVSRYRTKIELTAAQHAMR